MSEPGNLERQQDAQDKDAAQRQTVHTHLPPREYYKAQKRAHPDTPANPSEDFPINTVPTPALSHALQAVQAIHQKATAPPYRQTTGSVSRTDSEDLQAENSRLSDSDDEVLPRRLHPQDASEVQGSSLIHNFAEPRRPRIGPSYQASVPAWPAAGRERSTARPAGPAEAATPVQPNI